MEQILSADVIWPSPQKVESLRNWPVPVDIHPLQSSLGFMKYYRRFIHGFSKMAAPLNDYQTKDVHFNWTPACQNDFELLHDALTCEPVVKPFASDLQARVETYSSSFGTGAVSTQKHLFYQLLQVPKSFWKIILLDLEHQILPTL